MQSNIRSFAVAAGTAALVTLGASSSARAADEPAKFAYTFNIGAVSDYMFRGFSQRDDKPAIQGGADISYGIGYAGIWASNVDENFVATNTEIDLYAGIKPVVGPVTFDLGVIYYGYPSQDSALAVNLLTGNVVDVDYFELKAGASMSPIKDVTVGATFYYSPEYSFETGPSFTYEGSIGYTLPAIGVFTPTINAVLGHQSFDEIIAFDIDGNGVDSITYWNAGLSLAVEKITLDFRYWGSSEDIDIAGATSTDDRFVFGMKVALP